MNQQKRQQQQLHACCGSNVSAWDIIIQVFPFNIFGFEKRVVREQYYDHHRARQVVNGYTFWMKHDHEGNLILMLRRAYPSNHSIRETYKTSTKRMCEQFIKCNCCLSQFSPIKFEIRSPTTLTANRANDEHDSMLRWPPRISPRNETKTKFGNYYSNKTRKRRKSWNSNNHSIGVKWQAISVNTTIKNNWLRWHLETIEAKRLFRYEIMWFDRAIKFKWKRVLVECSRTFHISSLVSFHLSINSWTRSMGSPLQLLLCTMRHNKDKSAHFRSISDDADTPNANDESTFWKNFEQRKRSRNSSVTTTTRMKLNILQGLAVLCARSCDQWKSISV